MKRDLDASTGLEVAPLAQRITALIEEAPSLRPRVFAMRALPLLMGASSVLGRVENEAPDYIKRLVRDA